MEVSWIKLSTGLFEDPKVRYLLTLPDGEGLVLFWVRLLTLAGRLNRGGAFYLTGEIAYTAELLAGHFCLDAELTQQRLELFLQLGMLACRNGVWSVAHWDRHQNVEALERLRPQDETAKRPYRRKKPKAEPAAAAQAAAPTAEALSAASEACAQPKQTAATNLQTNSEDDCGNCATNSENCVTNCAANSDPIAAKLPEHLQPISENCAENSQTFSQNCATNCETISQNCATNCQTISQNCAENLPVISQNIAQISPAISQNQADNLQQSDEFSTTNSVKKPPDTIYKNKKEKKIENERENMKAYSGKMPARFAPPTLEQVQAYCRQRGNGVDPRRFLDYYASNGWRVGPNPMRDWQAAVRGWESNGVNRASPPTKTGMYDVLPPAQQDHSLDAFF